jgi:hypothetical protein
MALKGTKCVHTCRILFGKPEEDFEDTEVDDRILLRWI